MVGESKRRYNYIVTTCIYQDKVFDDIPSLQVVRSEAASVSSSDRKNAKRVIGSVSPMERKQIGSKCDFIIRDTAADHEERQEYGVGEVGIRYEKKGTKLMTEGAIKIPKVLKDMLDRLLSKTKDFRGVKTFGLVHSGLTMQLITADRPHRYYITRVSPGKELHIPPTVEKFGTEVLPVLLQVWQLKQQVLKVRNMVMSTVNNEQKKPFLFNASKVP